MQKNTMKNTIAFNITDSVVAKEGYQLIVRSGFIEIKPAQQKGYFGRCNHLGTALY